MLEQRAVPMTEEEIDTYYRERYEADLKRYYAIQANRAIREDRFRLIRMAVLTITALVICTLFLKLNFQVHKLIELIFHVQQQKWKVKYLL